MKNKKILEDRNILVIGGAGFIGSFVVTELLKEPIKSVVVYDNFARGKKKRQNSAVHRKKCSKIIITRFVSRHTTRTMSLSLEGKSIFVRALSVGDEGEMQTYSVRVLHFLNGSELCTRKPPRPARVVSCGGAHAASTLRTKTCSSTGWSNLRTSMRRKTA